MRIEKIPIELINPAPYNPRKDLKPGDVEYEKLKRSIDEFDLVEPLVWNEKTGNLVGGHQRLKILLDRGDKEVEVSVVNLDEEKERALNIALNKIQGDWDYDKLREVLDELNKSSIDVEITGFDIDEIKVDAVQYEPKGEASIDELVDVTKYNELIRKIEEADIDEKEREFLKLAATRFLKFNYAKIADYYANAGLETQELFEDLALVIIDFEDAIAKGFVRFSKRVAEMYGEDYER